MGRKGTNASNNTQALRGEKRKVARRKTQHANKEAREGVRVVTTSSEDTDVSSREDTRVVPTKNTKAAVDKPGSTVGGGKSSGFQTSKPKASRASKEKKPNILAGMSGGERDTIRAGWDQNRTEADQRGGGSRSEETTASMPSMTAQGPLGALSKDLRTGLTVNRDHLDTAKGVQRPDDPVDVMQQTKTVQELVDSPTETVRAEGPSEPPSGTGMGTYYPTAPKRVLQSRVVRIRPDDKNKTTRGLQGVEYAQTAAAHQKNLEKDFSQTVSGSTLRQMSEDFTQTVSGTHFLCPECHVLTPTTFVSRTPGRMGARCADCAGE